MEILHNDVNAKTMVNYSYYNCPLEGWNKNAI